MVLLRYCRYDSTKTESTVAPHRQADKRHIKAVRDASSTRMLVTDTFGKDGILTNFDFLMTLFNLSPNDFIKIGFDHSQVSRWRSGKRRLMPGRHPAAAIAGLFCAMDEDREHPLLERILRIWYPDAPWGDTASKHHLLECFLTEKEQCAPTYQKVREARLGFLRGGRNGESLDGPCGIEAICVHMLDFLDRIIALDASVDIYFVYTGGQFRYLGDPAFGKLLMAKLSKLFLSGCRLMVATRIDRAVSDAWDFHRIRERIHAHLRGYIRTYYFHSFHIQEDDRILGTVPGKLAFQVSTGNAWDYEQSSVRIYDDPEVVADVGRRISSYFDRSAHPYYYDFFNEPSLWLEDVQIPADQPCYLFMDLPHFNLVPPDEFRTCFNLGEAELVYLQRVSRPLLLPPSFFNAETPVRHIFCAASIDEALAKKRHQSPVLSALLGRKVWLPASRLIRILVRMQTLLAHQPNYEVCFLDHGRFHGLLMQVGIWGLDASICWLDRHPAVACRDSLTLAGMQSVCAEAWADIPSAMRSKQAAMEKLRQWIKAATLEDGKDV